MIAVLGFVLAVLAAVFCACFAEFKHRSVLPYTLLGFVLPPIGVLLILLQRRRP